MNKSEFQALRAELGICENISIRHPEAYAKLIELFSHNPKAGEGILELHALRNPKYGGIDYHAVYATGEYTISVKECFIKNNTVEAQALRKVNPAARTTIRAQIEAARTRTPCPCGSTLKLEVDHVRHFDDLLTTFLNGRVPLEFEYTAGCEAMFLEPLASEWREFHQTHAELRMLCKQCNLKRPRWKKPTKNN